MVSHVPHAPSPVTHPLHNLLYPGCLRGEAYVTSNFYASYSKCQSAIATIGIVWVIIYHARSLRHFPYRLVG
jgi:hypothetical protein